MNIAFCSASHNLGDSSFYLKNLFANVTGGKTYDQGQIDWRKRVEALEGKGGGEGERRTTHPGSPCSIHFQGCLISRRFVMMTAYQ